MNNSETIKEVSRPIWRPDTFSTCEWTNCYLMKYLGGRSFTQYSHGTCAIWIGEEILDLNEANQRLKIAASQHPDFRVQRHIDGNYLVTFKGSIGGIMSGELLMANLGKLRQEALTLGVLPNEKFLIDHRDSEEELDMIAGLYVRARLYQDSEELMAARVVRR